MNTVLALQKLVIEAEQSAHEDTAAPEMVTTMSIACHVTTVAA